jgi:hypothetical protein
MRREQVLALGVDAREPRPLVRARECRPRRLGEAEVEIEMAIAHRIGLARRGQQLQRVLANGLQQPVAFRRHIVEHERLLHEVREQLEHIPGTHLVPRADRFGRFDGPAAGEHREPAQERALGRAEQLVAPVDRGAQRPLARQRGDVAVGEHAQRLAELGGDPLGPERLDARGGELDRQWNAVEPRADLGNERRVRLGEAERRQRGGGPIHEKLHRFGARELFR